MVDSVSSAVSADSADSDERSISWVVRCLRFKLETHRRRTLDAFREMDADLSGDINRREFLHGLQKLVPRVTSTVAAALFKRIDRDKSGSIEYSELHALLRAAFGESSQSASRSHNSVGACHMHVSGGRDDVVGLAGAQPPTTALTLPPVPSVPHISPLRHRRVGRRLPIGKTVRIEASESVQKLPRLRQPIAASDEVAKGSDARRDQQIARRRRARAQHDARHKYISPGPGSYYPADAAGFAARGVRDVPSAWGHDATEQHMTWLSHRAVRALKKGVPVHPPTPPVLLPALPPCQAYISSLQV